MPKSSSFSSDNTLFAKPERNSTDTLHADSERQTTFASTDDQTSAKDHKQNFDEPPDGGYGWVVVTCVCLINAHTWGITSSYGVFLSYYLTYDYFPGATFLHYAFIGGLELGCCMLVAPLATIMTRRFGVHATLLTGVTLEVGCLIAASFATKIWQLILSQGIGFGFGIGFLFTGSVGVPPQWFNRRRSLSNAFSAAGTGLGGMIYSLATGAMIESLGLQWALRILGIVCGIVNLTCSLLVRDRTKQVGAVQVPWDMKLWKRFDYVMLELWSFLTALAFIVLIYSLPDYASSLGMTQKQATNIGALFNLGQLLGRPMMGFFSDSFGRLNMACLMTLIAGFLALVVWIFADSYGVLIFYSIIGGAVSGVFWATIAAVTAEVIGLQNLPAGLSMTWIFLVCPLLFSEPIALELAQKTSLKYLSTQLFAGLVYIGAAACLYCVRMLKIRNLRRNGREDLQDRRLTLSTFLAWTKV